MHLLPKRGNRLRYETIDDMFDLKAEVPKTRVIMLSTGGDETCRRAAEKYGADAFLPRAPI